MQGLTPDQARALQLAAQGLLAPPARKPTRLALRQCIERMQLLQIDTIHVVARSPYLVLFSRLGDYPVAWLEQALERGDLFETWAHEACFVPIGQLALHRSHNRDTRQHWGLTSARDPDPVQQPHLDRLLAHVRAHGAVRSADFTRSDDRSGSWWGWKDEKIWLEALFARGDLMVARRDRFQRVYDLAERVCPALADLDLPDPAAVRGEFVERAVQALGIAQARWIHDYFRTKPRLKDADLEPLVAQGRLQRVPVHGWDRPGYVHRANRRLLAMALRDQLQATHSALLSPFDPLVWDRERVLTMFDFDYRIECYTPQEKRIHGYFVLPLLHRSRLVGRLDAKAHRQDGVFEVKSLFLESGVVVDDDLAHGLALAIVRCADWHGTPAVRVARSAPARLAPMLRRAIRLQQKEAL